MKAIATLCGTKEKSKSTVTYSRHEVHVEIKINVFEHFLLTWEIFQFKF